VTARWLAAGVIPILVGGLAFAVYRLTLAPGLTWSHAGADGGDLITAAVVWGVPHPPGYPTYTLLGHLFAALPFGSPAFNLNLMSATCSALAAALVAGGILRSMSWQSRETRYAAAVAGLTLAFGPMPWGQATIAEVHALNALFAATICFIVSPWSAASPDLDLSAKAALGVVWGLGLGNSLTIAAFAPLVLPALWSGARGRAAGFGALGTGLCVYALIPIQSSARPVINWGDVQSLESFIWLVSGGLYRGYALAAPIELVLQRLLTLPRLWLEQAGWIGGIWIAYGIAARKRAKQLTPASIVALLTVVFATTYNTSDSDLYLIPLWVLSAGYLGIGLAEVFAKLAGRVWRAAVTATAGWVVIALLVGGWRDHDLSQDRQAAAFAESALPGLPRSAILVTHADAHTFTLWYYRLVRGWRTDVSIVDARLAGYVWYEPMLSAQGAAPLLPADRNEDGLVDRLAAANPARPVCDLISPPQDDHLSILRCD